MVLVFFSQLQLRKRRYRILAVQLGAVYLPQGPFKTGKIAGTSGHRKYTVEIKPGFHGSIWTVIEMQCANKGIPLHIHARFFKDFPNWRYAFTEGDRTERVFTASVTVQGAGIALDERYRTQVQSLFQEFALADAGHLKRGQIRIERDHISFSVRGIVKKLEEIREVLSVLARLADRVESSPVI